MANLITNNHVNESEIQLSNGLTSVYIDTLCLAGSDIATQPYEKNLLIWFAQKDGTIVGYGFEGFDIVAIIWSPEMFDKQKNFLLLLIDAALAKRNWRRLQYVPRDDMIFECLSQFREMVRAFEKKHIVLTEQDSLWEFDAGIQMYERCKKHDVYMHAYGCVVCNNAPL